MKNSLILYCSQKAWDESEWKLQYNSCSPAGQHIWLGNYRKISKILDDNWLLVYMLLILCLQITCLLVIFSTSQSSALNVYFHMKRILEPWFYFTCKPWIQIVIDLKNPKSKQKHTFCVFARAQTTFFRNSVRFKDYIACPYISFFCLLCLQNVS
jgi:hypothetical protein